MEIKKNDPAPPSGEARSQWTLVRLGTLAEGSRAPSGPGTLDEILDDHGTFALHEDVLNLATTTNPNSETILADSADCQVRLAAPDNHGTIMNHLPNFRKIHDVLESTDCFRNGLASLWKLTLCSQRSAHLSLLQRRTPDQTITNL